MRFHRQSLFPKSSFRQLAEQINLVGNGLQGAAPKVLVSQVDTCHFCGFFCGGDGSGVKQHLPNMDSIILQRQTHSVNCNSAFSERESKKGVAKRRNLLSVSVKICRKVQKTTQKCRKCNVFDEQIFAFFLAKSDSICYACFVAMGRGSLPTNYWGNLNYDRRGNYG